MPVQGLAEMEIYGAVKSRIYDTTCQLSDSPRRIRRTEPRIRGSRVSNVRNREFTSRQFCENRHICVSRFAEMDIRVTRRNVKKWIAHLVRERK